MLRVVDASSHTALVVVKVFALSASLTGRSCTDFRNNHKFCDI